MLKKFNNIILYLGYSFLFLLFINLVAIAIFFFSYSDEGTDRLMPFIKKEAYTKGINIKKSSHFFEDYISDYKNFLLRGGQEIEFHPSIGYQMGLAKTKFQNVKFSPEIGLNHRINKHKENSKADYIVYCFGGSTTFGTMTDDSSTYPHFLQDFLNKKFKNIKIKVINLGIVSFGPIEETRLFHHLLNLGHRPSAVIFLDGVNLGALHDGTEFSTGFYKKTKEKEIELKDITKVLSKMPIIKLLKGEDFFYQFDFFKDTNLDLIPFGFTDTLNHLIYNRFAQNSDIRVFLGEKYDIPVYQFLQPTLFVSGDRNKVTRKTRKYLNSNEGKTLCRNYKLLYQKLSESDKEFINLAYLTNQYKGYPYVELVHYSPDFNHYLAESISMKIDDKNLMKYKFEKEEGICIPFKGY